MPLIMLGSKMNSELLLVFVFLFISLATAYPKIRIKRSGISDQRVAELETLLALARIKNSDRAQVAYGIFDPQEIGRKKRSFEETKTSTEISSILQKLFDISSREDTRSIQSSLQMKRQSSVNKLLHKINPIHR